MIYMENDIEAHPHLMEIYLEYKKACDLYPSSSWPWKSFNFVDQVSVMMEEAGEAVREVNRMRERSSYDVNPLYRELAQTAAMCLRCMTQIEEFRKREYDDDDDD